MYVKEKHSLYRVWHYLRLQASIGDFGTLSLTDEVDYCIRYVTDTLTVNNKHEHTTKGRLLNPSWVSEKGPSDRWRD